MKGEVFYFSNEISSFSSVNSHLDFSVRKWLETAVYINLQCTRSRDETCLRQFIVEHFSSRVPPSPDISLYFSPVILQIDLTGES